jgi:dolichyl-diphosphooligosaccharide---protein glycosyltransferase
MMERSFLYRLHGHGLKPGVQAPADKFQEVHRSKYGKVRIFKILGVSEESKVWVADPANKMCDVPGSWFCPGQYPPGLNFFLSRKMDFAQLEDFNKKGSADSDYQKQYFKNLDNPEYARQMAQNAEAAKKLAEEQKRNLQGKTRKFEVSSGGVTEEVTGKEEKKEVPVAPYVADKAELDRVYKLYANTEVTTRMWQLISGGHVEELTTWIEANPAVAYVRSEDGRGPMWWAFESRNQDIVKVLMKAGVPHTDADVNGKTPVDLLEGQDQ